MSQQRTPVQVAGLICLMAAGLYAEPAGATSAPAPSASSPAAAGPAGQFIKLETGTLFIPVTFGRAAREVDLLVHFHGDPPTVGRNVEAARLDVVVLIINYPGLSAAYANPLRDDPDLFDKALAGALARLEQEKLVTGQARWRTVCVSSFSAGFGAVRELLKQDRYVERIRAICMLDSIYAGYAADSTETDKRVEPENMLGYRRFARAAALGDKTFILTHSYLVPGSYASTIETADDLISHVGARRRSVDESVPDSPVQVVSRAQLGEFKVWGCAGTDGEAHMQHLRHMRIWLPELPWGQPAR